MATVVVLYTKPEDVAGFEEHYRAVHVPLAQAVPGATWTFSRWTGTPRGGDPDYHLMARAEFADADALQAGLSSQEMRAAGRDAAEVTQRFGNRAVTLIGDDW